jgi:hypothetical protein
MLPVHGIHKLLQHILFHKLSAQKINSFTGIYYQIRQMQMDKNAIYFQNNILLETKIFALTVTLT